MSSRALLTPRPLARPVALAARLRAGVPVLRRDARTRQVGLGQDAVQVPDALGLTALLAELEAGHVVRPEGGAGAALVRRLLDLRLADPGDGPSTAPTLPAATVVGPAAYVRATAALLTLSDAGPLLVLGPDPVPRAAVDAAQRAGRAHLVVAAGPDHVVVGPYVEPGRTACLRCLDASGADEDPAWPRLVEAAAARPGPAAPPDPVRWQLGLALAVADLAAAARGARPLSWSATCTFTTGPLPTVRRVWRHPCCGCAWDVTD